MNYLLQGTPNPTGISAVAIQGGGYGGSNDAKGIDIPAALNADPNRPPVAQGQSVSVLWNKTIAPSPEEISPSVCA